MKAFLVGDTWLPVHNWCEDDYTYYLLEVTEEGFAIMDAEDTSRLADIMRNAAVEEEESIMCASCITPLITPFGEEL